MQDTVERLLRAITVPAASQLGSVVLTNSAAIGAGRTQRVGGRKHRRNQCMGFYHAKRHGAPASIELVVDNVVAAWPAYLLRFPLVRDAAVSSVLFHELGHHFDRTIGAPVRSGEAAADAWRSRLSHEYFRARYWWFRPFVRVLRPLARCLR